jgi:hypothetical protein
MLLCQPRVDDVVLSVSSCDARFMLKILILVLMLMMLQPLCCVVVVIDDDVLVLY